MKMPSNRALVLNTVLIGTIGAAGFTMVRNALFPARSEACAARYFQEQALPLRKGADLLTVEDLQASLNGMDNGVIENLTVRTLKEGPAAAAIGAHYGIGSKQLPTGTNTAGGFSFPWQPGALPRTANAACLSYHVYVPADFDFGFGGVLPGLTARDGGTVVGSNSGLDTGVIWRGDGLIESTLTRLTEGETKTELLPGNRVKLQKGRWVRVDHEMILNTPKTADGIIRTWIDKTLVVETIGARLRDGLTVVQTGVAAKTYFGGDGIGGAAPKEQSLWMTPFEVRWNK
jgi:hypothetical protein